MSTEKNTAWHLAFVVWITLLSTNASAHNQSLAASPPKHILEWATVLESEPDPEIIRNAETRKVLAATGLPWKVQHRQSGIVLLLVPPGAYRRGELAEKPEEKIGVPAHQASESLPAHKVVIPKPFYLGQTEVSIDQWTGYAAETGYKTAAEDENGKGGSTIMPNSEWKRDRKATWRRPSPGLGDLIPAKPDPNDPVTQLAPEDAEAFVRYYELRLPTEIEWEYAARAGTTTKYWWGDETSSHLGDEFNVVDLTAKKIFSWRYFPFDDGYITVAPTNRTTRANPWGFVDILGNVQEWMANQFDPDFYFKAKEHEPVTPEFDLKAEGEHRAYRGGCWDSSPGQANSYTRGGYWRQTDVIGFRVLKQVP